MVARVSTYSRRDTYESSRLAIYAITARRHRAARIKTRGMLMHERCHAVPFRSIPRGRLSRGARRRR